MEKNGQITIFIIVGVILIVTLALVIVFQPTTEDIKPSLGVEPIRNYVESCVKDTGKQGLTFIGMTGGYYDLPEISTGSTAIYFDKNKKTMPSLAIIQEELSKYIDNELFFCLKNFKSFDLLGLDIELGKINTTTFIRPDDILFIVKIPISIVSSESTYKIESVTSTVDNIRLKKIYSIAESIVDEQLLDKSSVCLSCNIDLGIEHDVYIRMDRINNDTITYTITDPNSKIDNNDYKYSFTHRYEGLV